MQCEFSKAELIRLDLAVMDRATRAKGFLSSFSGKHDKLLEENIEQLEALHEKLDGLIKQLEVEEKRCLP